MLIVKHRKIIGVTEDFCAYTSYGALYNDIEITFYKSYD